MKPVWAITLCAFLLVAPEDARSVGAGEPPQKDASQEGERSQDEDFEDDGFGDDDFGGDEFQHREVKASSGWTPSLSGFSRSDIALWSERFDAQPVAKLRQSLDLDFRIKVEMFRFVVQLHGEYDFATLVERNRFDTPTLEAYETKVNTREAFVAVQLGDFQISIGRLIDVWAAADLLTVVDVTNPRDLREPGTTDLDDIRLPILGTRLSWSSGRHGLEFLMLHEHDMGYRPAPLSDYSPLRALIAEDPLVGQLLQGKTLTYRQSRDRFSWDSQTFLGRWTWNGPSIDLSVMGGSLLDRQGVFGLDETLSPTSDVWEVELRSPRYEMVGHTGNWVVDKWVLSWEVAFEHGRHFNVSQEPPFPTSSAHLINGLVGVRYTGVTDLILSLELQRSFLLSEVDELLFDVEALNVAFLVTYTTLSERLELSAAWLMSGAEAQYGWMLRGEIGWRIKDGLRLGLGYVTYQPGDEVGLFYGLDTHDRLFVGFRWDFQIL